jgi:hypothetical protein
LISRLALFALTICTLLAAVDLATAQPLSDAVQPTPGQTGALCPALQDLAILRLYVVRQGRVHTLAYGPRDLTGKAEIPVDGYVNGVVLLSTAPMTVCVNRQPMSSIGTNVQGYYHIPYYGYLSRQDFWSSIFPADSSRCATDRIHGYYSRFPKIPGNALSTDPRFPITINRNGVIHRLLIRQHAPMKLKVDKVSTANGPAPEFDYLGNDSVRFDHMDAAFQQRAQAILAGIRTAENATLHDLVQRVTIIDYDGPHNALSCEGRSNIWIYNQLFWDEPLKDLRILAEHESMHILSDRLGLPDNSHIRDLFASLMGFGPFSRARLVVLASGNAPVRDLRGKADAGANPLFNFISEFNFLRGTAGGHAQDDVYEFCASFLHTLLYINRLGPMLRLPVKTGKGSFIVLTAAQQAKLLNDYRRVLATIVKFAPKLPDEPVTSLLQASLELIRRVGPSPACSVAVNLQP